LPSGDGGARGREQIVSEEVDLIVVHDHKLAEQIVAALKPGGIHHVDFWPEHLLRPGNAYSGSLLAHGMFQAKKVSNEQFGPFHIRVREEDLVQAQLVLTASGLVSDQR
jgi:hypothetical protein